ncbi:hypothetical protein EJV46_00155 [Roseococcus sp. SYP-B2431]|uniref:hypothetical protein n=1 Tax=Roseococcus sp. SYP-B2431 TaxID=2496640 RepID=UPI00103B036D|nr:hypothetical protein [Roseococcus sp. SYP-B2431]TCI00906.1 hypothetical protein EJV46_00155 [Roseococcus sp. SYP-B2431]
MTARETSLRWFIIGTAVFTAWRMLTTTAWLLFGPGLDPAFPLTQVFFHYSKAFLGGLFWPISLLIQGFTNPFGWLFPPW